MDVIAFVGCIIIGIAIDFWPAIVFFLLLSLALLIAVGFIMVLFMGHVQAARGTIILSILTPDEVSNYLKSTSQADAYYRLDLDRDSFDISLSAYQALKSFEHEPCTLYYLSYKQRREILSLDIGNIKRKHDEE